MPFPPQEFIAHIVLILQSYKTLKWCEIQALSDYNGTKKRRALDKHFQNLRYNFLSSCHSSKWEKSVRRKEEQVDEAREIFLRREERNSIIRFWMIERI